MNDYLNSFDKQISTGNFDFENLSINQTNNIDKDSTKEYLENSKIITNTTKNELDNPNPSGVKVRRLRLYKQQWIKK